MKQRLKDNAEDLLIVSVLTLLIIFVAVFACLFIEMLNDHRCYNLPPQEFFNDPKCERYWTYRDNN